MNISATTLTQYLGLIPQQSHPFIVIPAFYFAAFDEDLLRVGGILANQVEVDLADHTQVLWTVVLGNRAGIFTEINVQIPV